MTIRIIGTGSATPGKILTNAELENMVETSDEWIRERTGIAQRRIAKDETLVEMAADAAVKALDDAKKKAEEVELIIVATCSPEYLLPCVACQVQKSIDAKNAVCFDLNAACSGFLFSLETAYAYITAGLYKNALIIGSEKLSNIVDWEDRGTCVLFGDGAGAVYVEASEKGILSMVQGSNGYQGMVLSCDLINDRHVRMEGKEVYRFATRQVPLCIEDAVEKAGLTINDIDLFILHQANIRIIEAIAKRLGVSMEKVPTNVDRVGNTSSASIPTLLDELNRCGTIKKGQKIVLSGFGAGLTYGACVLEWDR